jgi:hypothetical protein
VCGGVGRRRRRHVLKKDSELVRIWKVVFLSVFGSSALMALFHTLVKL